MNISGVSPSAGIYSYNSIRLGELRNQQIAASQAARLAQEQKAQALEEPVLAVEAAAPNGAQNNATAQNFDSYDFAQTYRAGEVYDLKGADSDINSLDVAKAVSDMSKDQILQQYQYFVGDGEYGMTQNAATVTHATENFIL